MTVSIAHRLRVMAHQLAASIEVELTELTPPHRGDLRMLPCDLLAAADELDPAGAVATMPRPSAPVIELAAFRRAGGAP